MRKRSVIIVIIGLFYFLGFSQTNRESLRLKLDSLFESEFDSFSPGGVILLKKGNEILYLRSFGLANLVTKEKVTENTSFNTGSISKTFVSNGILLLKERGKLSLEDNLSMYFKDFKNKEIANKIKIKHLLSHTSGLPDNRKVKEENEFYLTAKDKENFEPLKFVDSLNFEPGERFEYSNPAFNGLALIIEEVTGEKWQKFIEDNIFALSNMKHSKITDGDYPQNGVAHGYELIDHVYVEKDYGEVPTFAASGNCGVWSSVIDLANYEKAIHDGVFLSKKLIKESRSVYQPLNWKDSINPRIGYSWFLIPKSKRLKTEIVYHTGSNGGYHSFYYHFPKKDILYVGLFNRQLSEKFWDNVYTALDELYEYNWFD